LKNEFLANTSHELRNALHGMLNILNSILEKNSDTLDEESKKSIEIALGTGRHMSMTLDDLLDIIHLKDGKPKLSKGPISLTPIVTGIIDMMRHMTTGKDIMIYNKLMPHLPDVYADENRVIQVLFNLLH